ncbi:alpha-hydroxy acid oxidase [Polaromonas sp. CG_23.6]|uniref:alpha-hydroxy acid oxidase n=1 Tax=unclassified Polaromonas TaxID=2638319 RepID=UPI001A3068ED|nr:alpha-hydroxy acid oxidase [Polaromonas sp. CG_23.6]MBG6071289.1 (S)-mandelate dehydrogenase [Polaromonas sp. CG_9.7]MBG6113289.1 (S)-mandelate dehydrogenase [Polaromonas sp. CG_9.2]MDH6185824.1 (S)-mandelate dehydrogenase [Polaromonas sp. CG_23.6]
MPLNVSKAYSIEDLRRAAQRRLPKAIFDFFDGGAEDEITLRDNRAAYQRVRLMPKVLTDVSTIDTSTDILGQRAQLPMAIAPTGAVGFGWRGGDIAIARAAAAAGIPYTLSSTATASIEQIANAAPGRLWFQAYILRNKPFLQTLIDRAQAADYEALVITVDLPVGGKRERDFRNDFSVPFRFTPKNLLDFARHPGWLSDIVRFGMPVMENLIGLESKATNATAIASSVGRNYDPSFNWEGLQKIRDGWPRKLIVKGILSPDDALRVAAMGCDAVVVSNHGGRQLDGAVATFDALPGVVKAIDGRIPVLLDGGVRRGSDIFKALAMGAQGVMLGRATLYGASAAGEPGASRALAILKDELVRTMQLCGVRSTGDANASFMF